MGKIEYFIELLRKKALKLIKNSDSKNELKQTNKLSALIKLLEFIYEHSQKLEKIQDILYKLNNENKHKVYIELLNFDDIKLYEYIFDFYINNLNSFYKNIPELFKFLNDEKI